GSRRSGRDRVSLLPYLTALQVHRAAVRRPTWGRAGLERGVHRSQFLLKLLSEIHELPFQVGNLLLKARDFILEARNPLGVDRAAGSRFPCWLRLPRLHITGQQVRVARLLGARLPGEHFDQWRLAL